MRTRWILGGLSLVLAIGLALVATAQESRAGVRLLVVDETKTFLSTMRVAGLVGALRQAGMFDVSVALGDVASSYDNPLAGRVADADPYDIILIVPRGLDDGSIASIWVVSGGLDLLAPSLRAGIDVASAIIDQVFAGIGVSVDVYEDLFPAFLWALYSMEGWIR